MREGWTYKKLGECFPYIKNGANIKQIKGAKGYPITRIETLSGGVFNRDRMGYADIFDINKFQDYILKNGDLLMSHINSKAYIGRTVQYTSQNDEVIIHGMNLLRLKSNESVLLSSFFKFYTDSWHFKTDIASIRKDAVNQSSFAISDLKNFKVPVPSLSEQQSIVAELDKINELISLKKAQLSDLDSLAQSIFYDMFGDPIENEKGWEVKKLGEVSVFPSKRVNIADLTPSQYIGVENLRKDKKGVECSQTLPNADKAIEFITDDILIGNIRPYLRKIWISNINGGASGDVIIVRKNTPSIMPMYLFKVLSTETFFEYDNANTHGAKMPRGDKKMIELFPIPLPPLSLQQEFAKRIELIEQQKAQISSTIKDLETLLASRMQYWFDKN